MHSLLSAKTVGVGNTSNTRDSHLPRERASDLHRLPARVPRRGGRGLKGDQAVVHPPVDFRRAGRDNGPRSAAAAPAGDRPPLHVREECRDGMNVACCCKLWWWGMVGTSVSQRRYLGLSRSTNIVASFRKTHCRRRERKRRKVEGNTNHGAGLYAREKEFSTKHRTSVQECRKQFCHSGRCRHPIKPLCPATLMQLMHRRKPDPVYGHGSAKLVST